MISIHAPPRGATLVPASTDRITVFQFTPLREGRRHNLCEYDDKLVISIHAPPRGATPCLLSGGSQLIFQFTPLREGRQRSRRESGRRSYFNSRPSARGDCRCIFAVFHLCKNFNSRPSARGDQITENASGMELISIHAPPRGATNKSGETVHEDFISIHAPPRGATWVRRRWRQEVDFNSRPSARGDVRRMLLLRQGSPISIHAPPRGATSFHVSSLRGLLYFNSRPSARGDRCIFAVFHLCKISIHAPPRGATLVCVQLAIDVYFNSRPSARGDAPVPIRTAGFLLFQFTPLREGRPNAVHD